jgi:hypothetical protein
MVTPRQALPVTRVTEPAPNGQPGSAVIACAKSGKLPAARPRVRSTAAFDQAAATYARWLPDGEQLASTAVMCTQAAAMHLDGDSAWLAVIGGSGAGKTERVNPLTGLPNTILADEITGPAAFLSITPILDETEQPKNGGLLPQIGKRGTLIIRDFTSVLTLSGHKRAAFFSALRHIYDGHYSRDMGPYGGIHLEWNGQLGLIICVTDAIDRVHAVANDLGSRWLQIRLPINVTDDLYVNAAFDNTAAEIDMRAELQSAVHNVLLNPQEPYDAESARPLITSLAMLLARARSPVDRNYSGDIERIPSAEKPTRVVKQLKQMYRAAGVIGAPENLAREMITRIAIDTVPMMRGVALRAVAADPAERRSVADMAASVGQPERSLRRAVAELEAHGLIDSVPAGQKNQRLYGLTERARGWIQAAGSLPDLAPPHTPRAPEPADRSRRASRADRGRAPAGYQPETKSEV